ncbi:MAG: CDP-alcohol phosphatidyltransferase family protein [Acidobacteriia bacterium]|nr:CDP-alcohol phosphatidyltransferase family protein [Terriglobia bacterium]
MRAQIPNALSVSRVFFGLVIVLLSRHLGVHAYVATVSILIVAMGSDALDGYFARRWELTSEIGYVLDAVGDRALHLAMLLVLLVRYRVHPVFVWLLVFRDVGIYAVRILSKDWLQRSRELRWISLFHATNIRLWFGLFVLREGFKVYTHSDLLGTPTFDVIQLTILWFTITLSYYGLFRSFGWLTNRDHRAG